MPLIMAGAAIGAAPNAFIAGSAAASITGAGAAVAATGSLAGTGMAAVFATNPVGWAAAAAYLGWKILPKLFGGGKSKKAIDAVGKEVTALRDSMNKNNAYNSSEDQRRAWSLEKAVAKGGSNTFAPRQTQPAPVVGGDLSNQYVTPTGDTNWEYSFRRMANSGLDSNIGL